MSKLGFLVLAIVGSKPRPPPARRRIWRSAGVPGLRRLPFARAPPKHAMPSLAGLRAGEQAALQASNATRMRSNRRTRPSSRLLLLIGRTRQGRAKTRSARQIKGAALSIVALRAIATGPIGFDSCV
jgi:hypothetical protein